MGTFRSGKTHRAQFQAELALEGKWLRLTEQDIEPATGYQAEYLIGYDAAAKQIVEFDANNFGAAMYTSSTGWTANTLTATSPVSAAPPAHTLQTASFTRSCPATRSALTGKSAAPPTCNG